MTAPTTISASRPLTDAQRATLAAVAARVVPGAGPGFAGVLAARVERVEAPLDGELRTALDVFGGRLAALLTVGRPTPFARLAAAAQDAMLRRWEGSRLPVQRTVFQALRRLTLATYYGTPEAQATIGYLGALHRRAPVYAWEGALAGAAADGAVAGTGMDGESDASAANGRGGEGVDVDRADRADVARARGGLPPRLHHAPDSRAEPHLRTAPRTLVSHPVADGEALVADVIVVGSGAGGAVAAARLAEAGRDVLILEAGSLREGADFTEDDGAMAESLYADQGLRASRDLSLGMLQGACVGGGTTINWMIMLRPHEGVLDEWARRFGTEGMSAGDLAPVFDEIEREVHARPVPDDAHSPNNRIILDGARTLGWRAGAATINARGCVRSGFCGHGCRYGAKQGGLATYLPRAQSAGARLVADARVDRIDVVERGTAAHDRAGSAPLKRVSFTLRDPATGRVIGHAGARAPVVVLAGGAVETPALLQRSGLGGGGVGRYLRVHPTTAVAAIYDHDVYAAAGIPLSAVCDEFARRDDNGYGFWIECPPLHPVLAAAGLGGFGAAHAALLAQFPRMGALIALVRDGADLDASNGDVRVDRHGNARVRYRLGAKDATHLRLAIAAAARLHLAAGAREAVTLHSRPVRVRDESDLAAVAAASVAPNDVTLLTAHVNGTCRLGVSPRTSGARPDGQRHGVPGLYVCDGSLLPTAPGVNPQATIMALASVVARRILERA